MPSIERATRLGWAVWDKTEPVCPYLLLIEADRWTWVPLSLATIFESREMAETAMRMAYENSLRHGPAINGVVMRATVTIEAVELDDREDE